MSDNSKPFRTRYTHNVKYTYDNDSPLPSRPSSVSNANLSRSGSPVRPSYPREVVSDDVFGAKSPIRPTSPSEDPFGDNTPAPSRVKSQARPKSPAWQREANPEDVFGAKSPIRPKSSIPSVPSVKSGDPFGSAAQASDNDDEDPFGDNTPAPSRVKSPVRQVVSSSFAPAASSKAPSRFPMRQQPVATNNHDAFGDVYASNRQSSNLVGNVSLVPSGFSNRAPSNVSVAPVRRMGVQSVNQDFMPRRKQVVAPEDSNYVTAEHLVSGKAPRSTGEHNLQVNIFSAMMSAVSANVAYIFECARSGTKTPEQIVTEITQVVNSHYHLTANQASRTRNSQPISDFGTVPMNAPFNT